MIYSLLKKIAYNLPILCHIYRTKSTAAPITIKGLFFQKVLGFNRNAYWPTHHSSVITGVKNIKIGISTAPGLSPGCYIQGSGLVEIGDYTIIAPNVGIITANHQLCDYFEHKVGHIKIGRYCWIGMNAVVLPDVILGDHTIVAAGSVVTKSFEDGYCVLGGNPARVIRHLDVNKCIERKNEWEYIGYHPS